MMIIKKIHHNDYPDDRQNQNYDHIDVCHDDDCHINIIRTGPNAHRSATAPGLVEREVQIVRCPHQHHCHHYQHHCHHHHCCHHHCHHH